MGLRVAFFVNWFPVISEPFIYTSAASLVEAGHEVDIYALRGRAPPVPTRHKLWDEVDLSGSTVTVEPGDSHLANAPGAMVRAVQNLGGRALGCFNPVAHRRYVLSLQPLFQAASFRRRGRYDILHAQFSDLAHIVLRHRRAGLLSGKVVTHFRGHDLTSVIAANGLRIHKEAFRNGDWFTANCQHFRDLAIEYGCPPERTTVVPSGIRVADFPMTRHEAPKGRAVRLLCFGRLTPHKGFPFAIRALAKLRAEQVDATLTMLGDGPQRAELAALVDTLGVSDRVTFFGAASQQQILDALKAADIVLAPSMVGPDGTQDAPINVLKEAMLAGNPVIATRHGGIPELVEHGETGLLVDEGDADGLAQSVRRLLSEPDLWPIITANARARVEKDFSDRASLDALLRAYEACLTPTTGSRRQ